MFNDFNFFGADDFSSSEDVLLEALDIRMGNMQSGTFERVLNRELKPFLDKNKVQIQSVKVPRSPKREQNPQTKEHLQSYRINIVFSDSQKMQWMVQFAAKDATEKITDPSLKGFVAEIKINGQVMPLNTLGADRYGRIAADASSLKKLRNGIVQALESNHADYADRQKQKIDQTGNDKSTKLGQTEDQKELAKKFRNKDLGGDDEQPTRRLSKAKQLEVIRGEIEESRNALEQIQLELQAFQSQEETLINRNDENKQQIAELEERLQSLDETEI